jgi:thioredoxin 1
MAEEEKNVLMCLRAEDMPEPNTDASVKTLCHQCKAQVWISGAGQAMVDRDEVNVVCTRCVEKITAEMPEGEKLDMVVPKEVVQESLEQLLLDAERNGGGSPKRIFDFVRPQREGEGRSVGRPEDQQLGRGARQKRPQRQHAGSPGHAHGYGRPDPKTGVVQVVENVTNNKFKTEVLDSSVPVLVDFYADWCGPCRALAPVLKELDGESDGKFKILKVDADAENDLCTEYGISSLPTVLVFKDGKLTAKLVGLQNKARLSEALGL